MNDEMVGPIQLLSQNQILQKGLIMVAQLKPLKQQVMVITGASSGIGLATAQAAAAKGVTLVLAARSDDTLGALAQRINATGGTAIAVHCDVAERNQIDRLVAVALQTYGRIDTWVNNAGLGMHGKLEKIDLADARRLFDVNFWGVVYGSLAALPHLKRSGGALINVGSEVSEAPAPLLGIYTASKHAVKGFTDSLRVEAEDVDGANVSITLIQPTAVNTPFPEHSRNYMSQEPKLPTPMIDPQKVAEAILKAAEKPTRSKKVGLKAIINTTVATMMPSIRDTLAAREALRQHKDEPPRHPAGILRQSSEACQTAGRTHGLNGNGANQRKHSAKSTH
jgi:short-subunit dehydrogenase